MNTYTLPGKNITITEEELNQLIAQKERRKSGIPELGTHYWYLGAQGEINSRTWCGAPLDYGLWHNDNVYPSKPAIVAVAEKRKAYITIKQYLRENNLEFTPDWDSGDLQYFIGCNTRLNQFVPEGRYETNYGCLFFFECAHQAKQVIELFQPELKVLFGVEE